MARVLRKAEGRIEAPRPAQTETRRGEAGGFCEFRSKGIAKPATLEAYGNQVDEPLARDGSSRADDVVTRGRNELAKKHANGITRAQDFVTEDVIERCGSTFRSRGAWRVVDDGPHCLTALGE